MVYCLNNRPHALLVLYGKWQLEGPSLEGNKNLLEFAVLTHAVVPVTRIYRSFISLSYFQRCCHIRSYYSRATHTHRANCSRKLWVTSYEKSSQFSENSGLVAEKSIYGIVLLTEERLDCMYWKLKRPFSFVAWHGDKIRNVVINHPVWSWSWCGCVGDNVTCTYFCQDRLAVAFDRYLTLNVERAHSSTPQCHLLLNNSTHVYYFTERDHHSQGWRSGEYSTNRKSHPERRGTVNTGGCQRTDSRVLCKTWNPGNDRDERW